MGLRGISGHEWRNVEGKRAGVKSGEVGGKDLWGRREKVGDRLLLSVGLKQLDGLWEERCRRAELLVLMVV